MKQVGCMRTWQKDICLFGLKSTQKLELGQYIFMTAIYFKKKFNYLIYQQFNIEVKSI